MEVEPTGNTLEEKQALDLPQERVIYSDTPVSEWNWPDGFKPAPELMIEMERRRQEKLEQETDETSQTFSVEHTISSIHFFCIFA